MRQSNDILRSLGIYLASSLGAEWEVRFGDLEGDFRRPFCRVESASDMSMRVQGMVVGDCRQTFTAVCYPEEKDDNEQARLEAGRVEELLVQALFVGTRTAAYGRSQNSGTPDVNYRRAHPLRIPIWNCAGVALDEPVPDGNRDPRDFAAVDQEPTIRTLEGTARDDEVETLYTVVAEVRLSWTRSLAVLEPANPVVGVLVQPGP